MLTKTALDKLAEKLAEELDFEELTELSRLCGGAYGPGAFVDSEAKGHPIIDCSALYAGECGEGFNEQVCYDQARFDWPGCRQDYSGAVPHPENPPGPPGAWIDDSCDDHTCVAKFTCSEDEEEGPFGCDYSSEFACQGIFICFGEYTCEESHECAAQYGCTGGYSCSNQHSCPNTHTCGEGVGPVIGDQFNCQVVFGCGHNEENPGGNFTCRENHNCTQSFTCHFDDNCGEVGVQGTMFTCGTDTTEPPSGNFECVHEHSCREEFTCIDTHTCGDGVLEDTFRCGASPDKFECLNSFHCKDDFLCGDTGDDTFTCGDGEGDIFLCGDGDRRLDEFGCFKPSDGEHGFSCNVGAQGRYSCEEVYTCDNNRSYECTSGPKFSCSSHECNAGDNAVFRCSAGAAQFECTGQFAGCEKTFACKGAYNCPQSFTCLSASSFRCDSIYDCSHGFDCSEFDCEDEAGVWGFKCAGGAGFDCLPDSHQCRIKFECTQDLFDCASASYVCDAEVFDCSGGGLGGGQQFGCSSGPGTPEFNCGGGDVYDYWCGGASNAHYECSSGHFGCTAIHVFFCSYQGRQGDFSCSAFTCRPGGQCTEQTGHGCSPEHPYVCPGNQQFAQPGDFACWQVFSGCEQGANFTCVNQVPGHNFVCPSFGGRELLGDPNRSRQGDPDSKEEDPARGGAHCTGQRFQGSRMMTASPRTSVTHGGLVALVARRSQITVEEARGLLDIVLKRYFDIDASRFKPETDLARMLDIHELTVKLGYAGVM